MVRRLEGVVQSGTIVRVARDGCQTVRLVVGGWRGSVAVGDRWEIGGC